MSAVAAGEPVILSGPEIGKAVDRGDIVIRPWSHDLLNPNSVNFRLGAELLHVADQEGFFDSPRRILIPRRGWVLRPRNLYLGATAELIGSSRYVMTLLGRSSMGRLGLFLNATADLGHVGAHSHWTLELSVVQPLRVYPGLRVGQVAFWHQAGPVALYDGRYQEDRKPVICRDSRLTERAA